MGAEADTRAEGEGANLGEAKWTALKALERDFPGISADSVAFEVIEEADEETGRPARVAAEVDIQQWERSSGDLPEEPAERVRAIVTRVVTALDLRASVDVEEDDEEIRATVNGEDLGLLIGRHGQTIDALQHIVVRAAFLDRDDRKRVVVDAAGYRARREAALRGSADRAVSDALTYDRPVELEPMSAFERRIVHTYLKENADVDTHSEGDEPERRLVVTPVRAR